MRPPNPERPGVGLPVGGVVQHSEDVMEQVLHTQAEFVEVVLGGVRQVGTAPIMTAVETQAFVTEPGGKKWLRKSEQGDKWNRCLIEGMIVLSETGARDEQTTPP